MQMIFSSFVLPQELKKAWKKAARSERVSANEFLRRCLREGINKQTASNKTEVQNGAISSELEGSF
jgi:hypothetical protein